MSGMKLSGNRVEAKRPGMLAATGEVAGFAVKLVVAIFAIMLPIALPLILFIPTTTPAAGAAKPTELSPWFYPVLFLAFPVFFIYLFCAIMGALSYLGGWYALGRKFRAAEEPTGLQALTWQSARVGMVNYNNVLKIRVTPQGLYLACPNPFRFMHPPLLIPWHEIREARRIPGFFGGSLMQLVVGEPKLTSILLFNKKSVEAVEPWMLRANELNKGNELHG